jgi:hypothetical protein
MNEFPYPTTAGSSRWRRSWALAMISTSATNRSSRPMIGLAFRLRSAPDHDGQELSGEPLRHGRRIPHLCLPMPLAPSGSIPGTGSVPVDQG